MNIKIGDYVHGLSTPHYIYQITKITDETYNYYMCDIDEPNHRATFSKSYMDNWFIVIPERRVKIYKRLSKI